MKRYEALITPDESGRIPLIAESIPTPDPIIAAYDADARGYAKRYSSAFFKRQPKG
jgi:hypothetical protein